MKNILPLFLVMFSFLTINAQTTLNDIDKKLEKIYKQSQFSGFAIGVVKNDSLIFSKGYGYSNKKEKVPFTENTILPIASVSKTFISMALLKAFELNYFTSETPINEILPFKVINPNYTEDTIRIKHLYTHTSSILDNEKIYFETYQLSKKPNTSLEEFLKNYLLKEGKWYNKNNFDVSKAGEKYNYSNIASSLAAYLIEVASQMSFDEFTQIYIFNPLNLKNTHWFYDESQSNNYATLYEINIPDIPQYKKLVNSDNSLKTYSSVTYPDGSLRTSLNDLSKYIIEIIRAHNNQSNLLDPKFYHLLFDKQFDEKNLPKNLQKSISNQAIFWNYNRKSRLTHTGSDPGIFAVVSIDFQTNIGRIILINSNIDTENNEKIIKSLRNISDVLENIN